MRWAAKPRWTRKRTTWRQTDGRCDLKKVKGLADKTDVKRLLCALFLVAASSLAGAADPLPPPPGAAKSPDRVSLGDVEIKGEANLSALRLSQRNAYDLKEKIHLRTDFMDRVRENVPKELSANQNQK